LAPAIGLERFQVAFARALLAEHGAVRADVDPGERSGRAAGDDAAEAALVAALVRQPGFAVYRNTTLKGCIDALEANYPAVARLVGADFFRAAAAVYARANLPSHPMLTVYGERFADFLATFEPARELPYLPAVAQLDRFWTEAHVAADAAPLPPDALAAVEPTQLADVVLRPHPSARWAHFPGLPAFTIWRRNRAEGPVDESPIEWHGEGALMVRPRDAVQWIGLDAAGCAFLDACAAGCLLGEASAAAVAVNRDADLAALGESLFAAGAFAEALVPGAASGAKPVALHEASRPGDA
jgi:hypothetical protein